MRRWKDIIMAKFPSHYRLKANHPNSSEVHDARDNSSFHIAKSGLDHAGNMAMSKLPHFNEGGVAVAPSETPIPNGTPTTAPTPGAIEVVPSPVPSPQTGGAEASWEPDVPTVSSTPDLALPGQATATPAQDKPDILK